MSTLAYGVLTADRRTATPTTPAASAPSGLGTYIDTFAALVPAEVLAAHAVVITLTTEAATTPEGASVATITNETGLEVAFWVLLAMAPFLYVVGRLSVTKQNRWDWLWDPIRSVIPALAFFGWMLIQSNTALDALVDWSMDNRTLAAVLAAPFIAAVAAALSVNAKKSEPNG